MYYMTSKYRIPAPLQNTIDNLTYLACTHEGDKLFFKDKIHIKSNQWTARVRRYFYNENLDTQKKIIQEIVDLGLDSIKTYKNNVHYPRLVREFFNAKEGLNNLRNTYFKEGREVSDIDTQIYIMTNQLNGLDKELLKTAGVISDLPEYEEEIIPCQNI
jgi:hypothetical protein